MENTENTLTLRSGATIRKITPEKAREKNYLTRAVLAQMHLVPSGDPVAFDRAEDGSVIYFFDPERVTEAPPEQWYYPRAIKEV